MTHTIDDPLMICAAITGGGSARAKTPFHPVTHDELVREAVACWRAGAAMVHLHARDDNGQATMDTKAYRLLAQEIRAKGCDVVINFSAGDNGGRANHIDRQAVIATGADVVSFGAGSFNTKNRLYDNSPSHITTMLDRMRGLNVLPEVEIFDLGQMDQVANMIAQGAIPTPASLQFVFGISGGMPSRIGVLDQLLDLVPDHCHWCLCCQTQNFTTWREMALYAFLRGGHIRTGMEDVVHTQPNELATSNSALVTQWVETANTWGRPVMSSAELRTFLGLKAIGLTSDVGASSV